MYKIFLVIFKKELKDNFFNNKAWFTIAFFLLCLLVFPLSFGSNLLNYVLYEKKNGKVTDPYDILPKIKNLIPKDLNNALFHEDSLKDGSGAMKAFQILQFSQISKQEKNGLRKGLLNYCELDTLAMLMLYEHLNFKSSKRKK